MEQNKLTLIQEEKTATLVIRVFSAYLIGIPLVTFCLAVFLYGALKGWPSWHEAYLYPFTWILTGISVQASYFVAIARLNKKSINLIPGDRASLAVISRAVSILFFCLAIGTLPSYLS